MPLNKSTVTAAIAAAVTAVVLLSGCASEEQPESTGQTFEDHGSAVDEYLAATEEYQLPAGQTYPPPPFTDTDGTYESGYGTGAAVVIWNCAWGKEYLTLRGTDPAAAAVALENFAAIVDTDAYALYYDPASMHPLFENAIEDAQLGDPTGVQALVDGGCPK